MTAIDRAAIGFSIAIVAAAVAIAMGGEATQGSTPVPLAPVETPPPSTAMPVEEPTEPAMPVEEPTMPAEPKTIIVDMPEGTAQIGCQVDDACFIPSTVTINVGDTVSWTNSDVAAHTITSGSVTEGPTGIFDSSLVMAGVAYEHTFNEPGIVEYFCMVHPWMAGTVTVN